MVAKSHQSITVWILGALIVYVGAGLCQNIGTEQRQTRKEECDNQLPHQTEIFSTTATILLRKLRLIGRRRLQTREESQQRGKYIFLDNTASARSAYNRYDGRYFSRTG